MAMKEAKVTVDGETYWVRRIGPFDQLRLAGLGARVLGPLFKALASSSNARELLGNVLSGDEEKLKDVLDGDVATVVFGLLGLTLDDLVDRIDGNDLIAAVRLCVVGKTATPFSDVARMNLSSDEDYEEVMAARSAKHGALHQLKLLWSVVQTNLGPTTAGDATTSPEASPAPA